MTSATTPPADEKRPTTPVAGSVLAGRLVLRDPVGEGSLGPVWRAFDLEVGRWVAAAPLEPAEVGRAIVEHPHVLGLLDHVRTPEGPWATAPLVGGGTATQLLADHGPLPTPFVAVLLDQLLDALVAVHAAGLVHRDVTTTNLLLRPTGSGRPHLLLADFGLATRAHGRGRILLGTPGYASPEQDDGAPPHPRADLYSAGVVARELLTGAPPPGHASEPPQPTVAGPLADLVAELTAEDPDERPLSAREARSMLQAAGVPPSAPWAEDLRPPWVPDRLGPDPEPPGEVAVAGSPRAQEDRDEAGHRHRWWVRWLVGGEGSDEQPG
ncbi:serine/threonine-protein kinase [Nocardioides bruguierae]|uniref:serine/threonine-protein kinase n=1 Tax=Nocardioides bruguierae TaxID=2945102 RepID=UPI002021C85B|nr:serine/threonine-protein kinase [Nocardioides bruguierae]MCL8026689.1 serine/threonine protein kinase [Nocardioides bruguierae]